MDKIPCTVAILTRNSSRVLSHALEHISQFGELIICDGSSTDETIKIASQFGAKVLQQDKKFLDENGRLIDYSGPRNQLLEAASYDWILFLDSDERLSIGLVEEIRSICSMSNNISDMPFVYLVPRKLLYKSSLIEASVRYPSYQYRFFHRKHVDKFTRRIHERITFPNIEKVGHLKGYMIIPVDLSPDEVREKDARYRKMEIEEAKINSLWDRFRYLKIAWSRAIVRTIRLFPRRFFKKGPKLPLIYDVLPIVNQLKLGWGWFLK